MTIGIIILLALLARVSVFYFKSIMDINRRFNSSPDNGKAIIELSKSIE